MHTLYNACFPQLNAGLVNRFNVKLGRMLELVLLYFYILQMYCRAVLV